jgi:PAS domain S-box-containing protein
LFYRIGQRSIFVAAAILVGIVLLEWMQRSLFAGTASWLFYLCAIICALSLAALVAWLDARPFQKTPPAAPKVETTATHMGEDGQPEGHDIAALQQQGLLEQMGADLHSTEPMFQLNQELLSRAQEQANELARLNVELQLEMAMHKQAKEIAHTNEERFRNMADNIQEGLTIIENGRPVYVNERACEIFGDCPEGEISNRILHFAAPEERDRLREAIQVGDGNGDFPQKLEFWIIRKDGSRRCIRERYSNIHTNEITRTFIVTSDITERVQAVQALENAASDRTRELSTVLDVSTKIVSTLELGPLLYLILDQLQTIIPYYGVAIFTLEENKLDAVAYRVPGIPVQPYPVYLTLNRPSSSRQVVLEKKVLIIDDAQGETPLADAMLESSPNPEAFSFAHARSWIGIPLVVRDQVTGLLSLAHSEPGFYTQQHARLAMTIANQVAVAIENARLYEQAQSLAVLEERHRIARELHDSVTQLLYGICLYCTATHRSIRGGNYSLVEQNLEEIKGDALQALQEMRLLILELNPPMLQKMGLVAALQASLEMIETRTGLVTELQMIPPDGSQILSPNSVNRLPRAVETELYRIAMEALTNLVRYARAKRVTVALSVNDGLVALEICDNGVGFDLQQAKNSGGMGLHSMEQRARQIGGMFEITSSPGAGTRIRVAAPIEESWAMSTVSQQ